MRTQCIPDLPHWDLLKHLYTTNSLCIFNRATVIKHLQGCLNSLPNDEKKSQKLASVITQFNLVAC